MDLIILMTLWINYRDQIYILHLIFWYFYDILFYQFKVKKT